MENSMKKTLAEALTKLVGAEDGNKKIESVSLVGVVNKVVDTKFHALLNWAEYQQANVYSFYVRYTDGTSKTIETYDQEDINYYLSIIEHQKKKEKQIRQAQENSTVIDKGSIINQLSQLTELREKNVISEDVYNAQRSELLALLEAPKAKKEIQQVPVYNLHIKRRKKRKMGDAKEFLIVDKKRIRSLDLDEEAHYKLEVGTHTIRLGRAALRSEEYEIVIDKDDAKEYELLFDVGFAAFKTELYECE